jgi:hypothetical protein
MLFIFSSHSTIFSCREVFGDSCVDAFSTSTKKTVVSCGFDHFVCNTMSLNIRRCNLVVWKIIPSILRIFPDFSFRKHLETITLSRLCNVTPRHVREDGQIQHIHMGHLCCLRLPMPSLGFTIPFDSTEEGGILMWTCIVPLDDWNVTCILASFLNQFVDHWKDYFQKDRQKGALWIIGVTAGRSSNGTVNIVHLAFISNYVSIAVLRIVTV